MIFDYCLMPIYTFSSALGSVLIGVTHLYIRTCKSIAAYSKQYKQNGRQTPPWRTSLTHSLPSFLGWNSGCLKYIRIYFNNTWLLHDSNVPWFISPEWFNGRKLRQATFCEWFWRFCETNWGTTRNWENISYQEVEKGCFPVTFIDWISNDVLSYATTCNGQDAYLPLQDMQIVWYKMGGKRGKNVNYDELHLIPEPDRCCTAAASPACRR